jgi:predicted transcriptional regulator
MIAKLTPELREALRQSAGPVALEDEETSEVFYLVDEATLAQAEQQADRAAIQQGIEDMEAGRVIPLDEVMRRVREPIARATK